MSADLFFAKDLTLHMYFAGSLWNVLSLNRRKTTQHLECPEKRFQGKPKDSRSQKGGIRRSEGAMGDKWLAGCVTFRPKRSFADLQI